MDHPAHEPLYERTCRRLCTVALHSPSGAVLYQEGPTPNEDVEIDLVKVMVRVLKECHLHEPTQLHLVANDDDHTCFAVGNSFASLYWTDEGWWEEHIAGFRSAASVHPTDEIRITTIFKQVLRIGDSLRNSESDDHWTLGQYIWARLQTGP